MPKILIFLRKMSISNICGFSASPASKTLREAPNTAQRRPKTLPRGPPTGSRGRQDGPRGAEDSPRGPQEAPKRVPGSLQESPQTGQGLQDAPRSAQEASQELPRRDPRSQNDSFSIGKRTFLTYATFPFVRRQRRCKGLLIPPKDSPRRSQEAPKRLKRAPRRPKRRRRQPRNAPRRPQ